MRRTRGLVVLFAAAALAAASLAPGASAAPAENPTSSYIVVLEPGSTSVRAEATRLAREYGGRVGYVYEYALRGFSITTTERGAEALARSSRVDYVEKDQVVTVEEQTTPTGLGRIFAADADPLTDESVDGVSPYNSALDIDGDDDLRVAVDIAIIDTGIDLDHPDLNVVGGVNCLSPPCVTGGDDDHYHGTHVAGTAAALDNGIDVVGVAPGARLWAVKVLNRRGSGTWSGVIAGIDWVTANAGVIEVANMSLGGGKSDSVNQAVAKAVTAGVTMVVAAGNDSKDAAGYSPASEESAITVSALADFNGRPGGLAGWSCYPDVDDTFADFSNYGTGVDIIAPGVCITSTNPGGGLRTISGTSMAAPHVAGAAALLRSVDDQNTATELTGSGNLDWNDADDPDGVVGPKEPLLDVSDTDVFRPNMLTVPVSGTNTRPTASFTFECSALICSFDASGSTDPEGGVLAYAWNLGDGNTGTERSLSHTYDSPGTYGVTLTVTDIQGASDSWSESVTVASDGSDTLAFSPSSSRNGKNAWKATVSVSGASPGAVVTGKWDLNESTGGCTAGSGGTCSFSLTKIPGGVLSVTWTYLGDGRTVVVNRP